MGDDPTPGELQRRQDDLVSEMRSGFQSLGQRLDKMPTNELLLAHMATWDTQLRGVREDVDESRTAVSRVDSKVDKTTVELRAEIAKATVETRAEIKEARTESTSAKRWGISAVISAAGLLVAGLALARSFLG